MIDDLAHPLNGMSKEAASAWLEELRKQNKLQVREVVFSSLNNVDKWPPEDPAGFMAWFQKHIDSIPKGHMHTANIEITSRICYGGISADIEISYMREETDVEFYDRLEKKGH